MNMVWMMIAWGFKDKDDEMMTIMSMMTMIISMITKMSMMTMISMMISMITMIMQEIMSIIVVHEEDGGNNKTLFRSIIKQSKSKWDKFFTLHSLNRLSS